MKFNIHQSVDKTGYFLNSFSNFFSVKTFSPTEKFVEQKL